MSTVTYVERPGNPGIIAAIVGCVFGVLGILTIGTIFFWFAVACTLIALLQSRTLATFGMTVLSLLLAVVCFATSPGVWLIVAMMFGGK